MGLITSLYDYYNMETLKIDRLIDGENKICIGIVGKKNNNRYSSQAIKI